METRNITITLEKAIELYNSGNESLKDLALQAFSKSESLERDHIESVLRKSVELLYGKGK